MKRYKIKGNEKLTLSLDAKQSYMVEQQTEDEIITIRIIPFDSIREKIREEKESVEQNIDNIKSTIEGFKKELSLLEELKISLSKMYNTPE